MTDGGVKAEVAVAHDGDGPFTAFYPVRRTLTAAVDPDKGSLEPEAGPITIETAPFAQTG